MSGFVFHPSAVTDLDEIWEFIAADSLAAADRVLDEILEAIVPSFLSPEWVMFDLNSLPVPCVSIQFTVS